MVKDNGHASHEELYLTTDEALNHLSYILGAIIEKFGGEGKEITITSADLEYVKNFKYEIRQGLDKEGRTVWKVRRERDNE